MARIEYIKKAQQRFERVPVIDPETGRQQVVPVKHPNGNPKVTKSGREVTRRLTVADKTKPLPPYVCDHCRTDIQIGTPYKQVSPHFGATRRRHESCPTWQPWDLSDSVAVNLQRISYEADAALSEDDWDSGMVEQVLSEAADGIRELAARRTDAASAVEDGFGHETEMSQRLQDHGDELESFADEVESADVPDEPTEDDFIFDAEGEELEDPDGTDDDERFDADGTSLFDAMDQWRSEVRDAIQSLLDDAPTGDF